MKKSTLVGLLVVLLFFTCQFGLAKQPTLSSNEGKRYFVLSPDGKYLVKVFHTADNAQVRVHETNGMKMLTQWQIPDFQARITRFSLAEPDKLLIAGKKRLLVYRLIDNKQKLLFFQPKIQGQEIVQAYFNRENDEIVWATKNTVYNTDAGKNEQKELLRVPWEEGQIRSIAGTGPQDFAVNLEGGKDILLLTPRNDYKPIKLSGHKKPVVGLDAKEPDRLISLDTDYQLIVWNTATRKPSSKISLEKPSEQAEALGFSMESYQDYLSVISQTNQGTVGQRYAMSDLKKGKVRPETLPMTITAAGQVYSSVSAFGDSEQEAESNQETRSLRWQPPPPKKKLTLYELAKIEAEHEAYQAALELIKKIPVDDPEYAASRELKRKVFNAINDRNIVTAAREQMNQGNYQSARILLENALAKNPDSDVVARQLGQVEEKLDNNTWLKALFLAVLALLTVVLGLVLWRYQSLPVKRSTGNVGKVFRIFGLGGNKQSQDQEQGDLRRQFVYKLADTRRLLNQAAAKDSQRRYKNTWMEITARLNTMEKRAKVSDNFLAEFLLELGTIQQTIEKLGAQGEKKQHFEFEEEPETGPNQAHQEKTDRKQKEEARQAPENNGEKDYYRVLGLGRNATLEDVKKAYRKKMKEYHPDRHNTSDFTWVKEEADRRTKLVQEAYLKLSEMLK